MFLFPDPEATYREFILKKYSAVLQLCKVIYFEKLDLALMPFCSVITSFSDH